jgi:hypothetical protein
VNEELKKRFEYHELDENQMELIEELRTRFIELAQFIDANCPVSREKALAMTHLEMSSFYTNASVSRYS